MINIRISTPVERLRKTPHTDQTLDVPGTSHPLEVLLEKAVREALDYAGADPDVEVTLVLTGDTQLRKLNRDFLGIDSFTDVLAFSGGDADPDTGALYLGDVIISYQRARKQAAAAKHSIGDELKLLAVHGLLHLLGYDHTDSESETAMWRVQNEILLRISSMAENQKANRSD